MRVGLRRHTSEKSIVARNQAGDWIARALGVKPTGDTPGDQPIKFRGDRFLHRTREKVATSSRNRARWISGCPVLAGSPEGPPIKVANEISTAQPSRTKGTLFYTLIKRVLGSADEHSAPQQQLAIYLTKKSRCPCSYRFTFTVTKTWPVNMFLSVQYILNV